MENWLKCGPAKGSRVNEETGLLSTVERKAIERCWGFVGLSEGGADRKNCTSEL